MSTEVAVLQLIAYVMLTIASVTVAAVSAFLAYRSNYGWNPLLLVVTRGLRGEQGPPELWAATITFEVWNRRKYPIVIREVLVEFSSLPLRTENVATINGDPWHRLGNGFSNAEPTTLSPSAQIQFTVNAPLRQDKGVKYISDFVHITVRYFDPLHKRARRLRLVHRYDLGEGGAQFADFVLKELSAREPPNTFRNVRTIICSACGS